ncbi:MAG: hypothetical protein ACE5FA_11060 [Dehalococcoidia bacterium]
MVERKIPIREVVYCPICNVVSQWYREACTFKVRLGFAELLVAASAVAVVGLLVVALVYDWTYGLIPALTYGLAIAVSYGVYARFREIEAESTVPFESVVHFKVIDTKGECTLGRRTGDVIKVGPAGGITPTLCAPAAFALRRAATDASRGSVDEWCCPIHDHMLVFRVGEDDRAAAAPTSD